MLLSFRRILRTLGRYLAMSDVTSSSVWNENNPLGSSLDVGSKTRSPPPIPKATPVSHSALNSNTIAPNVVPVTDDLIVFESQEEMEASKPCQRAQDDCLREFLRIESQLEIQDYNRSFYQIRIEQDKFRMEPEFASECATAPHHYIRNRYRDILPYDHNRVEIKKDDENPEGYMNASFIQLPGGKARFIAAQAPLSSTLDEWWKMIDEHNVSMIVILCKLIENNKVKCERYWPTEINEPELFGDYEITLEEEKSFDDDEYVLRTLKMENQTTMATRIVYQLHYKEWPDHGCPSGEKQLLNMIDEMAKLHENYEPTTPILVHCSAGVGRTGTIIAVNHIREQINAGTCTTINVFDLVLSLRRQRASMVQTQDQYQFVHRCIAEYCRQKLGITVELKKQERPTVCHLSGLAADNNRVCSERAAGDAIEQQRVSDRAADANIAGRSAIVENWRRGFYGRRAGFSVRAACSAGTGGYGQCGELNSDSSSTSMIRSAFDSFVNRAAVVLREQKSRLERRAARLLNPDGTESRPSGDG
ncbi:unnamed protein product [Caenorhabditis bovis]|uniref:protein-tyrosine-phosphatase n=1 Tax=Caenorhabditis bovis TaxID=2654633 RepID=A0A8S1FDW2_9PELO|nr:unnamed protein product [Caenorhabditis bovis]